jgi:hypothetical protein
MRTPSMAGELLLPGVNSLNAEGLQVVDGGAHANGFPDRRCPGFEFVGEVGPGAVVEEHLVNHFATPEEGRHGFEHLFPAPQETDAGWPAELVGRSHQKVAAQLRHIHPLVGEALAGVHQQQGSGRPHGRSQLGDGIEATQGVAHMHQAHQPGASIELGMKILQIQFAA